MTGHTLSAAEILKARLITFVADHLFEPVNDALVAAFGRVFQVRAELLLGPVTVAAAEACSYNFIAQGQEPGSCRFSLRGPDGVIDIRVTASSGLVDRTDA